MVKGVPPEAVAVSVHVAGDAGAVNKPESETEPQVDAHETDWLALNNCVFRACRLAFAGVMVIGDDTAAEVLAVFPLPSIAVAVMVHEPSTSGAVKAPELVMEPHEADHVAEAPEENC